MFSACCGCRRPASRPAAFLRRLHERRTGSDAARSLFPLVFIPIALLRLRTQEALESRIVAAHLLNWLLIAAVQIWMRSHKRSYVAWRAWVVVLERVLPLAYCGPQHIHLALARRGLGAVSGSGPLRAAAAALTVLFYSLAPGRRSPGAGSFGGCGAGTVPPHCPASCSAQYCASRFHATMPLRFWLPFCAVQARAQTLERLPRGSVLPPAPSRCWPCSGTCLLGLSIQLSLPLHAALQVVAILPVLSGAPHVPPFRAAVPSSALPWHAMPCHPAVLCMALCDMLCPYVH